MTPRTPKKVAEKLQKSLSWVYAHAEELGGVRIGGSWFFTEEGLEVAFQIKRQEGLARTSTNSGKAVSGRFSHQASGRRLGSKKKTGITTRDPEQDPDRHGLGRFL